MVYSFSREITRQQFSLLAWWNSLHSRCWQISHRISWTQLLSQIFSQFHGGGRSTGQQNTRNFVGITQQDCWKYQSHEQGLLSGDVGWPYQWLKLEEVGKDEWVIFHSQHCHLVYILSRKLLTSKRNTERHCRQKMRAYKYSMSLMLVLNLRQEKHGWHRKKWPWRSGVIISRCMGFL